LGILTKEPRNLDEMEDMLERQQESGYPISPMQQGMLFESLANPNAGLNIQQMVCHLHEAIAPSAFQQAWQALLNRREILRTYFDWKNSKTSVQRSKPQVELPFLRLDWRSQKDSKKAELNHFLKIDREQEFDLEVPPLMRVTLIEIDAEEFILIWTFHHILLDGRSMTAVLQEFFSLYEHYLQEDSLEQDPLELKQLPLYQTYIEWLQRQDFAASEDFWKDLLGGFSAPISLAGYQSRLANPIQTPSEHGILNLCLSGEATSALQSFAQTHNLTLNTVFQGAWGLLLSRYSGEEDVVFGAVKSCRNETVEGANQILGLMINALPMRAKVNGDSSVLDYLQDLRSQWISLRPYEHTPLSQIQSWSDILGGNSLFGSFLVFENYDLDSLLRQEGGQWLNREFKLYQKTSQPLSVGGYLTPELRLEVEYDCALFEKRFIERLLGHFQTILENIILSPEQKLSDLKMIPPTEAEALLVTWNQSSATYSLNQCIHQGIETQAALSSEAIAVIDGTRTLSYGELNHRANQLARYLRSIGVGADDLVAIAVERSLELAIAVLGILKAGAAYVPLDLSYPQERVAYMLEDSQASVVLTSEQSQRQLPATAAKIINLNQDWNAIAQESIENLAPLSTPSTLAYVMYTSGSTGKPKGVQILHQGLMNHASAIAQAYGITNQDRVLQFSTISFDIAVEEIFPTWMVGATLVFRNDEMIASSQVFSQAIEQMHITLLSLPTAFWHEWVRGTEKTNMPPPPALRLVAVGGEKASLAIFATWQKWVGTQVRWLNTYGPTEATVSVSLYEPTPDFDLKTEIPIGRPLPNTQLYILDKALQPCPVGIPGELYIGGVGLAKGYLHRDDLTEAKFIPHLFQGMKGTMGDRLYKTGDLARYLPDGNIDYLGRIDYQVKIRGFRIEIEEIEATLQQHPQIGEAVIVVKEDAAQNKYMIAYLAAKFNETVVEREIRDLLKTSLPAYMVPSFFVMLGSMPITPGGKIDRKALTALPYTQQSTEITPPSTEIERKLVKIWESVLSIHPIGITDDFFELGGNSLMAMSLFMEIESTFNKKLPLATLFKSSTIEQIAQQLQNEQPEFHWRSLVAIQSEGSNPPLFFVHPIKGDILCYAALSQILGKNQPFYGLQARGLDGQSKPQTSIEAIAADYLAEIQKVQPQGPYHLGGYSFGGVVAFEMAQQLRAQNSEVNLVALLDPYPPQFLNSSSRIQRHLQRLMKMTTTKEKWSYIYGRLGGRLKQFNAKSSLSKGASLSIDARKFLLEETFHQAFSSYCPKSYTGKLVLFKTLSVFVDDDIAPTGIIDLTLKWGDLAQDGLEVFDIPSHHADLLELPTVDLLAETLKKHLDTLQSENTKTLA
jgi:amino acid adenylation domain-containing protein